VSEGRAGRRPLPGRWLAAGAAIALSGALVRGHVLPLCERRPGPPVGDLNGDGEVRIACLGDSNTALLRESRKWCEMVQEAVRTRGWKTFNYALTGATMTRTYRVLPTGEPLYASAWIERARAEVAPDVVVLAYLTNDVLLGIPPPRAVAELEREYDALRRAGIRVLVALCPPFFPREKDHATEVAEVNRRVRGTFPAADVVDFHAPMAAGDYAGDGIHIRAPGQEKRAAAALARLEAR
jgi:lysophospholipase L1-like esterase